MKAWLYDRFQIHDKTVALLFGFDFKIENLCKSKLFLYICVLFHALYTNIDFND